MMNGTTRVWEEMGEKWKRRQKWREEEYEQITINQNNERFPLITNTSNAKYNVNYINKHFLFVSLLVSFQ